MSDARLFTCTTTRATGGKRANNAVRDYSAGNIFLFFWQTDSSSFLASRSPPPLENDEMVKENECVSILHIKVVACLYSQSLRAAPCFPRHTSAKCLQASRKKWPRASVALIDWDPQKGKLLKFLLDPFIECPAATFLWKSKLTTINSCENAIKAS